MVTKPRTAKVVSMAAFTALQQTVDGHGKTLTDHEKRILDCEKYDNDQREFFKRLRTHVTRWGMAIFGAIMATGLIDNRAAHVLGAFINGLLGHPTP